VAPATSSRTKKRPVPPGPAASSSALPVGMIPLDMPETRHPRVLIVGSVAIDSVRTPLGEAEEALGGAAVFSSVAASFFAPVDLVGVVGTDFPPEHLEFLKGRGVNLEGLQVQPGETF